MNSAEYNAMVGECQRIEEYYSLFNLYVNLLETYHHTDSKPSASESLQLKDMWEELVSLATDPEQTKWLRKLKYNILFNLN